MFRADFGGGFVRPRGPLVTSQSGPDDDPGQKRLDELGRQIEAVREQQPKPRPTSSGRLNVVYRLSTEFVAAVFVGLALGWGFDTLTGWKPIGIVVFSMLGIGAAFYNVFRAARQLSAEQEKKD
jgi:ATP synthase protein I